MTEATNKIKQLQAQLAEANTALKEIAKDFGTDYCDGNTMIAQAYLKKYK